MEKINKKIINDLRYFLVLLGSQSISQLGSSMTSFALIIWAYQKNGTVMSISLLSVCTYLPYILVSVFAGIFIDKWNKKAVMLISDAIAAICTLCVLILKYSSLLQLWHLYIINSLLGLMNAFQSPASNVAVTLIVPKDQYSRASGLQSLSDSILRIFTPIFATTIISLKGLQAVLAIRISIRRYIIRQSI
ncbi:major facilitator superfamily MFS_1 [Proteiniborus sp. DW1]|uniref:MFS transporter n=1 Tax=Proteiniborus sp. DW1 TaxID=1889883 RepID=UPI00092E121A|nr:MFS transporter [Proteiniborus sp. DW1]SCG82314.1 major facilitator superfamily MFS_1 [Proteiniborus sp. DW1]